MVAGAGLIGGAVWALLGPALLVVRQVQVDGAGGLVPKATVLATASIRTGAPLITVNTGAVAGQIKQIRQVEVVRVSRAWPDGVVIWIRQRTPVFVLPARGGYQVLDEHGVVLSWSRRRPARLPLLRLPPGWSGRLRGDPAVLAAGQVVRALPASLRRGVATVQAGGVTAVTLLLRDGAMVSWGGAGRSADKVSELRILLRTKASFYDVSDPGSAVTGG